MTNDQVLMLTTHLDYYKQACERLTAELAAAKPPAPDCRTCDQYLTHWGYKCAKDRGNCTNGDQYKAAPAVALWRTE